MANGMWRRLFEFGAGDGGARAVGRPASAGAGDPLVARPSSAAAWYGAGWYVSTWDLQGGLDVLEGLPADARPDEALIAYFLAQGVVR